MGIEGTMLGQIERWSRERANTGALHVLNAQGGWDATTWKEYWTRVRNVGRGLMALGVKRGDSVSLIARNQPNWVVTQHGITAAGGIPCPIYTTNLADQVAHIVDHSESKIIFVDSQEQLAKLRDAQSRGKAQVDRIVTFVDLG